MCEISHAKKEKGESMTTPENHTPEEQLKTLVDKISAYVEQFHGGSVEFVSFDGSKLEVRLGGACLGCPLSPSTLQGWVAGTVHQFFPNIQVVAAE
jgi:Fe-S cluster biogenesis protein NfuA